MRGQLALFLVCGIHNLVVDSHFERIAGVVAVEHLADAVHCLEHISAFAHPHVQITQWIWHIDEHNRLGRIVERRVDDVVADSHHREMLFAEIYLLADIQDVAELLCCQFVDYHRRRVAVVEVAAF